MANERQPLVGTWGRVWLDGTEVAKIQSITADVTNNYENYYEGADVQRVKVSQQGSGTLTLQEVYNTAAYLLDKYLAKGEEPHFVIETNLSDPSAYNKQQEAYTINHVSFDSIPFLNLEKGAVVSRELNFAFPPSKVQKNAEVFPED
ncbi:MAG: hypothetical protein IJ077_08435 [Eubacterium sp.]|nr:hypothetical protein [Eubacterium sp.]